MAKCDLCKKWGKTVYDPAIKYPELEGKFQIWVSACDDCLRRYAKQIWNLELGGCVC